MLYEVQTSRDCSREAGSGRNIIFVVVFGHGSTDQRI